MASTARCSTRGLKSTLTLFLPEEGHTASNDASAHPRVPQHAALSRVQIVVERLGAELHEHVAPKHVVLCVVVAGARADLDEVDRAGGQRGNLRARIGRQSVVCDDPLRE
ncbi:hypothetical protein [Burkholderia metallica]|uniref:hypothetical protein n=1 Tax=Burkholderia metallica TaxID=488729 RepID=UPI0008418E68|nr:hypothetical protein [Burkholderia metallica]AOJ30659.1 hypothetical protein WJ16_03590 [Burkholderia metallica]